MKIATKFSLVFGAAAALSALVTAATVYSYLYGRLEETVVQRLKAAAALTASLVQPEEVARFTSPSDYLTEEYQRLKGRLASIQRNHQLSWVGIYRYDGQIFRAIIDGSEEGDSFCPDFPLYDVSEEMLQAQAGEEDIVELYADAYGTYLTSYHPFRDRGGKVIGIVDVSLGAEKLEDARKAVLVRTALTTLLVAAFTILVCFLISYTLTIPIKRLKQGVAEIAAGKLDHRIAVKSRDEVGYLTASFNEMAEDLQKSRDALDRRIMELSALNEISQELNFAPSIEDVAVSILSKAMRAINSSATSLLLLDASGKLTLTRQIDPGGQRLKSSESLLGPAGKITSRVAATGKPFMSGKLVADLDLGSDETPSIRSVISVPMKAEGTTIGVINVVDRESDEPFTEVDLGFISTMANHIALTVEKIGLYELAITDGLTRLYVHRYFQAVLEREIIRSKRYGSEVSLVMFDIDHFKKFNDTYGHQQGDMVLRCVAQIIADSIRKGIDIPARYGGEEFVVILPETGPEKGFLTAERLRKKVEAFDFPGPGQPLKVTISLGIATHPADAPSREVLIKNADTALYASKQAGRNRSTRFSAVAAV